MLACTLMHVKSKKSGCNPPPGPSLLTIIINSIQLHKKPYETIEKLTKVYGPIMRFKIGQTTTIIISSTNTAKEILQTHDTSFSDRTKFDVSTAYNHNQYSLIFLPVSPLWQKLRKICHENLFSTKTLDASQDLRRKKLHKLLGDIRQSSLNEEIVDIKKAAFMACINFLSSTFCSRDFVNSVGDDGEYKHVVRTILETVFTPNLVDYFPMLRMFDPQGLRRHTTNFIGKLFNVLEPLIEERMKMRRENDYVTNDDMLDILLEISERSNDKMHKQQIKHLFLDLLVAGTDTTAHGLERTMSEVMHNPEVMSKVKKELAETIGVGKYVEESDIARLPYLRAVIKEGLRMHPPAPFIPRRAKRDVEVCGYMIPQGAQVLINKWSISRNPEVWENAHVFSPERFLDSDIDVKGQHFMLTPFGSGRRMCPGYPLVLNNLWCHNGIRASLPLHLDVPPLEDPHLHHGTMTR
ncbi:hypothetical protein Fmac_016140 [Flemingia macrophylla]|uniref:Cytochrome P450 n=1 Tax=Flemingia macrophylla TaxID=520843 RepID=A0ABD1MGN0_9FABA